MEKNGNNNMNFGNLIAELRMKKNLTQKELANKLYVSDKTISRWENNYNLPDIDMLHIISKFFKIPLSELAILRVSAEGNEQVSKEIIKEFTKENTKKKRIIKYISIFSACAIIFLIGVLIFTNSFNKFKVYNVEIESDRIVSLEGVYIETRIKNSLYFNNLVIKNYIQNEKDIISVELYYLENDEENILYSYSSLNNIRFISNDSYIKINNLNKYFDNLYIKVTIIDSKNNEQIYTGKLKFILDFSNNKINKKEEKLTNVNIINLSKEEIKGILLKNGFKETSNYYLTKKLSDKTIIYIVTSNKFNYSYESNFLNIKYSYEIKTNCLTVNIFDKDNIEIENYTYDITNDKVTECITGKCNGYKEALDILNKNLLYLFYK